MAIEQKALQMFYKTIGPELDDLVIVRKDGITLHGKFTAAQFILISAAYADYLKFVMGNDESVPLFLV